MNCPYGKLTFGLSDMKSPYYNQYHNRENQNRENYNLFPSIIIGNSTCECDVTMCLHVRYKAVEFADCTILRVLEK